MKKTLENLRWGARWGLFGGLIYALFGVVILLVRGVPRLGERDVSLIGFILFYVAGGVLAGLVVGALRPFTRSRLGAVITGGVAAIPVMCGAYILFRGPPSAWRTTDPFALVLSAMFVGGMGGYKLWDPQWSTAEETRTEVPGARRTRRSRRKNR